MFLESILKTNIYQYILDACVYQSLKNNEIFLELYFVASLFFIFETSKIRFYHPDGRCKCNDKDLFSKKYQMQFFRGLVSYLSNILNPLILNYQHELC